MRFGRALLNLAGFIGALDNGIRFGKAFIQIPDMAVNTRSNVFARFCADREVNL